MSLQVLPGLEARMDEMSKRIPATLVMLKKYRQLTDRAIGQMAGVSGQKIGSHCRGRGHVTERDLAMFAQIFDVPEYVLLLEPDEALRWVLDHSPNQPAPALRVVADTGPAQVITRSQWISGPARRDHLRVVPDAVPVAA